MRLSQKSEINSWLQILFQHRGAEVKIHLCISPSLRSIICHVFWRGYFRDSLIVCVSPIAYSNTFNLFASSTNLVFEEGFI